MSEQAKDELLALKEILRQAQKMANTEGVDAISTPFPHGLDINNMETALRDYRAGRTTVEDFEAEIRRIRTFIERAARELDDPAMIMTVEAEHEAKARQLSDTAQQLTFDASNSAGQGISPEEWICEVLRGHSGDEDAQRRCLQLIVDLWSNGPWPWPRATR